MSSFRFKDLCDTQSFPAAQTASTSLSSAPLTIMLSARNTHFALWDPFWFLRLVWFKDLGYDWSKKKLKSCRNSVDLSLGSIATASIEGWKSRDISAASISMRGGKRENDNVLCWEWESCVEEENGKYTHGNFFPFFSLFLLLFHTWKCVGFCKHHTFPLSFRTDAFFTLSFSSVSHVWTQQQTALYIFLFFRFWRETQNEYSKAWKNESFCVLHDDKVL